VKKLIGFIKLGEINMNNIRKEKNEQQIIESEHLDLCNQLHLIYLQKNRAYGDSFHKLYEDLGIISAVTQISHKYNRLKNLAKDINNKIDVGDESIIDTLLDMANYCVLTALEIQREKDNGKGE
jgi:hypothetical protein